MPLAQAAATASAVNPVGLILVLTIIALALVFDFLNGFHDAANSIATIVSTRVLSPPQAVIWAAFFNFIAAFVFGTNVASTISNDLINPSVVTLQVVSAGLIGAIAWNIITWILALPTSSSHALVGALAGAAITRAGMGVLIWKGWIPLIIAIFLNPILGFILGMFNMIAVSWIFRYSTPTRVDKIFRKLQLVSAGVYSLGHGGNDAQKTMGIIVLLLSAQGVGLSAWTKPNPNSWLNSLNFFGHHHNIAWWIILSCQAAIALGTVFGGWRIVKTMGSNITRLNPVGGFCAEAAAATTIIVATTLKTAIPISTTHAITGAILGVGTSKSNRAVRWVWGQRIAVAWVLTIPCAAFIAAVCYMLLSTLF